MYSRRVSCEGDRLCAADPTNCPYVAQAAATAQRLEAELAAVRDELSEALKLIELQKADIDRYQDAYEKVRPNCPERVPEEQLQLAFERIVTAQIEAQNDNSAAFNELLNRRQKKRSKRRHRHGRRRLDLTNLPVREVKIDPPEVRAAGGEGYRLIGEDTTERIAFRPACYFRVRLIRNKWIKESGATDGDEPQPQAATAPRITMAKLPGSLWPRYMADPSAIARVAVSKYDDCLPLHRQEKISKREGFVIPRSTQCSWLKGGDEVCYRVVDAMFTESLAEAHCIATDSTGAPVKTTGACERWHVYVFIADEDHIVFRYTPKNDSDALMSMLGGFQGYLLADAAKVYDRLYRNTSMVEVGCWYHARRYWWRALETDQPRALEAMSLISKLFEVGRECRKMPLPERTELRAARAGPILRLLDKWIAEQKHQVDPRSPSHAAIVYYENQREALHQFMNDGRLRLDNNWSEQALRNLVLGRRNYLYFERETGLKWYATFRSLIASCALHDLNPQEYLEQLLRLAPSWPIHRVLELAPKYWAQTVSRLDAGQRAILQAPWEQAHQTVEADRNDRRVILAAA